MDKRLLIEALKSSSLKEVADADQIMALRSQFPFSQALQILAAKISHDLQLPSHQSDLQQAAVYSCDRAVLKDVMTQRAESTDDDEVTSENKNESPAIDNVINNFDVADALIKDLKKLSELKNNFEMLFIDQTTISFSAKKEEKKASDTAAEPAVKTRKQKIVELAKAASTQKAEPSVPSTRRKRKDSPPDKLIEELSSKEELEIEDEKQKEQISIIDQFIKSAPSIANAREKDKIVLPPADIAFIKTGEFNENVVSETLVNILVRQGKKEKAIEVLKKLIWKYPQKKAYFASQIEDLKK
ncbi:hypothetical protein [Chryseosolibacter indicus]|uniref:Tetratricopeptide repeat protein n=1 Tax=Chryseosolibacter indicus TaxID=2782351 RepID=A0ABS5VYY0_9BACT|nr:hypothetical protein [Chryseosolibacter indicus]MBT1706268.1 hypothetical protein [Chryseosolibacter indicus]